MIAPFELFQNDDRLMTLVQQHVKTITDNVIRSAILDGRLVTVNFTTPGADLQVTHGLNRAQVRWFAGTLSAPSFVYASPNQSSTPKTTILLRAQNACSCTLWFC